MGHNYLIDVVVAEVMSRCESTDHGATHRSSLAIRVNVERTFEPKPVWSMFFLVLVQSLDTILHELPVSVGDIDYFPGPYKRVLLRILNLTRAISLNRPPNILPFVLISGRLQGVRQSVDAVLHDLLYLLFPPLALSAIARSR